MMSKYSNALDTLSETLEAQYKTIFNHNGNRGDSRESSVIKFLSQVFPKAFGFSKGEIFDSSGSMSGEVDIIIFDEIYSPVFRDGSDKILCPNESSFGAIEVKSNLTIKELENCREKIDRYSSLIRPQAPENRNFVTPHIPLSGFGPLRIARSLNTPTYGVFAYKNSIAHQTLIDIMQNNKNISFIVVPGELIFIGEEFIFNDHPLSNFMLTVPNAIAIWVIMMQMRLVRTRLISVKLLDIYNFAVNDGLKRFNGIEIDDDKT